MFRSTIVCFLAAAVPIPGAAAQGVSVSATTLTQLRVAANSTTRTLPPNTDVSAGFALSVDDPGPPRASAGVNLVVARSPTASTLELREGASAEPFLFGPSTAGFGPQQIGITWRSPVPVRTRLSVSYCASWSSTTGSYQGRLDVVGHGSVVVGTNDAFCFPGSFPHTRTFDVVVDSSGLDLVLATQGSAVGSLRGGTGSAGAVWRIELRPADDEPCGVVAYGTPCGATLSAGADFRHPGLLVVRLHDASAPPAAWLLVGVRRVSIPLPGGCLLHTDALVILPWVIDQNGDAVAFLDPPPIPGLRVTAQAGTIGPALHTSNGLDILCP